MLLRDIAHLLIATLAGLFAAALMLRAYLVWLRMPRSNPMVQFCAAATDWIVLPLRHALPIAGRMDWASWVCLLLVAVLTRALLELLGAGGPGGWNFLVPAAIILLAGWAINLILVVVFAYTLLSLVNPHAPLAPTFAALTRPLLAPFRRWIPPMGGFDLSPTALILVLFILRMLLDSLPL